MALFDELSVKESKNNYDQGTISDARMYKYCTPLLVPECAHERKKKDKHFSTRWEPVGSVLQAGLTWQGYYRSDATKEI